MMSPPPPPPQGTDGSSSWPGVCGRSPCGRSLVPGLSLSPLRRFKLSSQLIPLWPKVKGQSPATVSLYLEISLPPCFYMYIYTSFFFLVLILPFIQNIHIISNLAQGLTQLWCHYQYIFRSFTLIQPPADWRISAPLLCCGLDPPGHPPRVVFQY